MDELMQKAIQQSGIQKKPSELIPWKLDEPWHQPYYSWDSEAEIWQPIKTPSASAPTKDAAQSAGITSIALYSWNIDFMLPCAEARMSAALSHLEGLTSQLPPTTAAIINLQETTPSDLITLSQQPWIRRSFYMTDLDSAAWASGMYGTTTLVDRRLAIASCFRVHYAATQFERDALFVDVTAPAIAPRAVRFGNSHLESLALDPPRRPAQMRVAARYLHTTEELAGAVIAGDFNAIQPFDATLHSDNDLKDAYLESRGREGAEEGMTWGQQAHPAARERFGLSRMDKAFFCGAAIKLQGFERIGADVVVGEDQPEQRGQVLQLGFEKAWVTDHLGIKATFSLVQDARL
ncbi:endonuclease exonuclease phosphatase family [Apiospora rasikravindrae]|uniref:Endonuclease exonuclease phosphatase family n=1 Tax=Apiospora rasikravindrae TaxID=990691 RepID=A0ABR1TFS1_9PEZI